jgi:hypothetical protein
VFLLDNFELEPGVVGDLVGEEGVEEGFENGVGEGFVVFALQYCKSLCLGGHVGHGGVTYSS